MCPTPRAACPRCAHAVPAGVTFCPACEPAMLRFTRVHRLCWACAEPLRPEAHNDCTGCGVEVNQSLPAPASVPARCRAAFVS